MLRCATCDSEFVESSKSCPACGAAVTVGVATGTLATVAMEGHPPPASATPRNGSANGAPAAPAASRSSLSQLSSTSIPDDGRFLPGTLVNGRYRIVGLLGRGGMGEVYRATDLTLAQPVALKFLPEAGVTERVLERFHAEVRIARQISHPNICRVYDIGEVDGQPFISMEYVDGEDLASLLQRIGRLPADKALETSRKICAGLAAAHDRGVIHRDLKPQNIMLNKRGEPVIMDFGLAAVATQLTGAEARNGTPAYMSPEQLRGEEVTAKSDIYALGLVLYEIFSGKRAYEAKTLRDLLKAQEGAQLTSLTSLAADVDPQVEKVIQRCLNPQPALRPATPLAVAAALPGGDPLAAALAAGETPSPEMVAASGKTEGMDLRFSIPLLLFVLAVVIGFPFFNGSKSVMELMPHAYSPSVAAHEARKIAASFGYTEPPRDTLLSHFQNDTLYHWETNDRKGKSWSELNAAEPFYLYAYRESPNLLVAKPYGRASFRNPAPVTAGMIYEELTFTGQLRAFEAVPPEKVTGIAGAAFDEAVLFNAVGYQRENFAEVAPERVPLVMADLRKAWKGPAAGLPDVEVRIEAASLAGRITAVKVVFPWTMVDREPAKQPALSTMTGPIGRAIASVFVILFVLIFAFRNLRRNRGDKKGAFRLALVTGTLYVIAWAGAAHHVPSIEEWDYLLYALSDGLYYGVVLWVLYIALEPEMRARWPQALVTWNRALTGRFGDAQVGAHILTGAALGMLFYFGFFVLGVLTNALDKKAVDSPYYSNLWDAFGALGWIGGKANTMADGIFEGFLIFFGAFFFRVFLKNDYAAAGVAATLLAAIDSPYIWKLSNPWPSYFFLAALFAVIILVLLRMGMVVCIPAILFLNTLNRIAIDTRLSAWYTPYGLASMALLVSIALYAFWRSIGARTLGVEEAGS